MCFFYRLSKTAQELENRFNAKFENDKEYHLSNYNGFEFPKAPVITNIETNKIQMLYWGLIPQWAKDNTIRKKTLNAKIETINERPSFRNSITNRCLIITDGFYEWQWLDKKGKIKQKYLISLHGDEAFAFAGLWNEWVDKITGEICKTYTVLTTEANELMSRIHNTKKRMPVMLNDKNEINWLNGQEIISKDIELKATKVT
ncbi:MAG: SOS response-associated peptidase [Bacteroidales bacterium]|jgi:putative SOS response-associated peptidase YedK